MPHDTGMLGHLHRRPPGDRHGGNDAPARKEGGLRARGGRAAEPDPGATQTNLPHRPPPGRPGLHIGRGAILFGRMRSNGTRKPLEDLLGQGTHI